MNISGERQLAIAVVQQALADLSDRDTRSEALEFLTVDLWRPGNLWGELLGANKTTVLRAVRARGA